MIINGTGHIEKIGKPYKKICGFIRTSSSYQKYSKLATAMNTLILNYNNWNDINRPKRVIDDKEAEEVESVTPFNFKDSTVGLKKVIHTFKTISESKCGDGI